MYSFQLKLLYIYINNLINNNVKIEINNIGIIIDNNTIVNVGNM